MTEATQLSEKLVTAPNQLTAKESLNKGKLPSQRQLDENSTVGNLVDKLKPAPPTSTANNSFAMTGDVWWIGLNNDQTHDLSAALASVGSAAGALGGPAWPAISAAVLAASGYILVINELGGSNGVDINGVVGTLGVIVTPRVGGFYNELIQAARAAVAARTILDFLVMASGVVPALGAALNLPVVAGVLTAVESGTPLGWAIAGALGLAVDLFSPAPDPNAHGHIWANRDQPAEWESFILGQLGEGNKVSLLSWQGLFSAQQGGGNDVYANRPQVGDWETWTLIDNNDGTVSFQTFNGNYLSAEQGGGVACYANRTTIGTWEKFYLVNLPDGKVALKTHDKGKFVSVQQ